MAASCNRVIFYYSADSLEYSDTIMQKSNFKKTLKLKFIDNEKWNLKKILLQLRLIFNISSKFKIIIGIVSPTKKYGETAMYCICLY